MTELTTKNIISNGDFGENSRDILSVLWAITNACNYNCSYCFDKKTKFGKFSSTEQLVSAAEKLLRLNRPAYHITLYGGEPTFHPGFLDLIDFLGKSKQEMLLRVFTNGSQSPAFFEKMVASCRDVHLGMIFSLHPEYANVERALKVVEITAGGGVHLGINLMYTPTLRDRIQEFADRLLELRERVPFFMNVVFPYTRDGRIAVGCDEGDHARFQAITAAFAAIPLPGHLQSPFFTRTKSNITLFRDGRYETLDPEQSLALLEGSATPNYKGFYCCGGTNVIYIEEFGAIRSGVCEVSKKIGNVFRDSVDKLATNMRVIYCKSRCCSSIENIPLPKFRHADMAEECLASARQRFLKYLSQGL